MPKELQSILFEDFEISWPGYRLNRIALNQHMPRVERLSKHRHPFHQLLVYLRGQGEQLLESSRIPVKRGNLLFIKAEEAHSFKKSGTVRPVCLAVDLYSDTDSNWPEQTTLTRSELAEIERLLLAINDYESSRKKESVSLAALILELLCTLRRAMIRQYSGDKKGPVQFALESTISREGFDRLTPGKIASKLDRSLDHLNRQLREECGLTVGGLLNRKKVESAGELLRTSDRSIGEIGSSLGMHDQNYFARWFRKHTGQTPTRWREAMRTV